MKLLRKVFSFLVIICLSLGIFSIKPASTKAVTNLWMELSNPRPGTNSSYKFHFTIEKILHVHEWIKLIFPPETTYEKTPVSPHLLAMIHVVHVREFQSLPICLMVPSNSNLIPTLSLIRKKKDIGILR